MQCVIDNIFKYKCRQNFSPKMCIVKNNLGFFVVELTENKEVLICNISKLGAIVWNVNT